MISKHLTYLSTNKTSGPMTSKNAKLTKEQVVILRSLNHIHVQHIAYEYNVSRNTIERARRYLSWPKVK
jgi:DNA-binding NarL/FixJ family response regulator